MTSVAATIVLFGVALWMLWRRPALVSRALGFAPRLARHADRVRALEEQMYTFASRHRAVLPGLAAAEVGFHALGVTEAYLTLWLLGGPVSLMTAFLFETANRLITVVFKFVPLRLGIDEAMTTYLSQEILGLGGRTGLALAIVRKIRVLFWAIAGGLVLVREGFTPGTVPAGPPLEESRSAAEDRLKG